MDWVYIEIWKIKEFDWQHGKIIYSHITPELINILLQLSKPDIIEIYNKKIFFFIFFDHIFYSKHYKTKIIFSNQKDRWFSQQRHCKRCWLNRPKKEIQGNPFWLLALFLSISLNIHIWIFLFLTLLN